VAGRRRPVRREPLDPVPAPAAWCEIDLGTITIEPSALGTQRWTGRIEAYTTDGTTQTVYVNLLELIPAGEGYGRARAAYAYKPGVVVARDDFTGFTTGNLNGRTAPAGWRVDTAGDATDFARSSLAAPTSDFGSGRGRAARPAARVRRPLRACSGSAMTDTEVSGEDVGAEPGRAAEHQQPRRRRPVRRHPERAARVLQPEHADALASTASSPTADRVSVSVPFPVPAGWFPTIRLSSTRRARHRHAADPGGAVLATVDPAGTWPDLATGGALASGKAGLYDQGVTSNHGRYYGKFYAAIPPPEPVVVNSGQSIEFRSTGDALRRDATGTYGGRAPAYRGARLGCRPPATRTAPAASCRRAPQRHRHRLDGGVTDSTQIVVQYTPRGLTVPH
jgi:hypothetical protein